MAGEAIVRRARALLGARFRPQGRASEAGLDCIGLVAIAVEAREVPADYRLRGGSAEGMASALAAAGLRQVQQRQAGDVLVMLAGPEQLHLGIWSGDGLIHADAGLRRVVERPGEPAWPILGTWRKED